MAHRIIMQPTRLHIDNHDMWILEILCRSMGASARDIGIKALDGGEYKPVHGNHSGCAHICWASSRLKALAGLGFVERWADCLEGRAGYTYYVSKSWKDDVFKCMKNKLQSQGI